MKIGDYVTRKKYNHDIVFKIIQIKDDKVYLHGEMIRLVADASIDDLQIYNVEDGNEEVDVI